MTQHDYGRAIGRIEGKLDRLLEDSIKLEKIQTQLHLSVETIKRKNESADERIDTFIERLKKVEEPLISFARWRERFTGAIMVTSFVAASLGGTLAISWQRIIDSLRMSF